MSGLLRHNTRPGNPGFPPLNISKEQRGLLLVHKLREFSSAFLPTRFNIDVFLPPDYDASSSFKFPVLFFNDGQDMSSIHLADTLLRLYAAKRIPSLIVVAIYAGERLQEYGIAQHPDYRHRGSKAGQYEEFVTKELLPYLRSHYPVHTEPQFAAFAGFSLGGLSAMDIVWNHPQLFGKVGVFSGSFWWRRFEYSEDNPDAGRIMHELLRKSKHRPDLKFWFQTGTMDESDDRNNNGVIDAIDDTLDIIEILKKLGYHHKKDIHYVEVKDGIHHPSTWGRVLPDFLVWAFGSS